MEIIQKVRETINKHSMLSGGDHVLVGLSGGPDSVCLAVILDRLREYFNLSLSAVYIDHSLRPDEVKKEVEYCKGLCEKLRIDFHVRKLDVKKSAGDSGINLQEAARELRYAAFEEVSLSINAGTIALGHNADDQAETVLMRLFRGSGRRGLTGIPPVRKKIIRPLIETERSEIEAFLAGAIHELPLYEGQPFMIDSSNLKDDYLRNWIRHSVMEGIRDRNPAVVRDICRTAGILREEEQYLEVIVTKTLMRLISRKSDSTIELFISPLEKIEVPILRRVLRRALDATSGLRGIKFAHVEDIIDLLKKGKAGDSINLPEDVRVIREYSILKMTSEKHPVISEYDMTPPCEIIVEEACLILKASFEERGGAPGDGKSSVLLDAGSMNFPLRIRARTSGDFFYPLGLGKKKKLQDFFVDEKIPREARDSVPIVVSGNDIIFVAGFRADDRFKVNEKTENILRLTVSKAN
ncbi:MAG: tRNA lysidine(34) synthetase TilS [Nitrospiraceae bacterium]|nr:MAG: tRNA lysidine(34) synthetase TilS [Nitrospiraceae bacterium]